MNSKFRSTTVALLVVMAVFAQIPAASAAISISSFEFGMNGWTRDHQIDCEQDPTPCTFDWSINRSTDQAQSGDQSLKGFLDGTNDDGTIWVEKRFDVRPLSTNTVTVSFWLWSEGQSDFNTWPVVAYAGRTNPERETDFEIAGQTDQAAGWVQYELTQRVRSGANGTVWVAFGFGATWESARTYYLDSATVRIR